MNKTMPTTTLIVIGGNPCRPVFYESFARALAQNIKADAHKVIGYAGFGNDRRKHVTLEGQIDHVRVKLEGIEGKKIVIGHSLGAYLMFEAVKKMENAKGMVLVGLMPFIQFHEERPEIQACVRKLKKQWKFRRGVAGMMWAMGRFLPRHLRVRAFAKSFDGDLQDIASKPSYRMLSDTFWLFREEYKKMPRTPYVFTHLKKKHTLHMLHLEGDAWGSPVSPKDVHSSTTLKDIEHSFSMRTHSREHVVETLTQILKEHRKGFFR